MSLTIGCCARQRPCRRWIATRVSSTTRSTRAVSLPHPVAGSARTCGSTRPRSARSARSTPYRRIVWLRGPRCQVCPRCADTGLTRPPRRWRGGPRLHSRSAERGLRRSRPGAGCRGLLLRASRHRTRSRSQPLQQEVQGAARAGSGGGPPAGPIRTRAAELGGGSRDCDAQLDRGRRPGARRRWLNDRSWRCDSPRRGSLPVISAHRYGG